MNNKINRIAIYGGSFDPIHSGHLDIIKYLSENYDKVIVVPTTVRYYKKNTCMFSFNKRYEDLASLTKSLKNVIVDDVEREAPNTWRYIDTLKYLIKTYGKDNEFYTVMGSDSFNSFMTWESWPQIMTRSDIIVVNRPGYPISEEASALKHTVVDTINNDMSSTKLRDKLNKIMEDEEFEDYLIDIGWADKGE